MKSLITGDAKTTARNLRAAEAALREHIAWLENRPKSSLKIAALSPSDIDELQKSAANLARAADSYES